MSEDEGQDDLGGDQSHTGQDHQQELGGVLGVQGGARVHHSHMGGGGG